MTDTYFERIEHTADLAIRVWGDDLPGMFVNAARALFALMSEAPPTVLHERRVVVESVDTQALLVDWLNELI